MQTWDDIEEESEDEESALVRPIVKRTVDEVASHSTKTDRWSAPELENINGAGYRVDQEFVLVEYLT